MLTKEFVIQNKVGLHARPAAIFVQTVSKFNSIIKILKDRKEVDAKSILGVLSLGVEKGETISVKINGSDETEAMEELENLIKNNFGDIK
jgi:phosphocarrier protein HPr